MHAFHDVRIFILIGFQRNLLDFQWLDHLGVNRKEYSVHTSIVRRHSEPVLDSSNCELHLRDYF
jgi:hypothetical protein